MDTVKQPNSVASALKFVLLSLFGIFMFFVPFDILIAGIGYAGKTGAAINTIAVDHIVGIVRALGTVDGVAYFDLIWGTIIVLVGIVLPFINKSWNKSITSIVFTVFKVLALLPLSMVLFGWELVPGMPAGANLAFIWSKVVVPVTTLVPVGAVFLAFITKYGLMEFVGIFVKPIMRPIWKTPGKSAVDAVASFVGSYSVGLLITDKMYQDKMYSDKESTIIATGFSTVSATFMVIVANSTGLGGAKFVPYFWATLVVTFLVTAITTRIFPINRKKDTGYLGEETIKEPSVKLRDLPREAWTTAVDTAAKSGNVFNDIASSIVSGIKLSFSIGPTLLSIGYFGLVLAFFGVFNIVGYIFFPFTWLASIIVPALGDPMLLAAALASSLAEMFIPVGVVGGASALVKAVIAIVCVSEIIFFSASVPCIMSTKIPIKITDILLIWFERVILSFIIAIPVAMLLIL